MRFGRPLRPQRAARNEIAAAYASARMPHRRTPWREVGWCAVDLELTGLNAEADEIISFGALPIDDGRVQLSAAVEGLARPVGALTESSIRVHGLRVDDLARAPRLADAIGPLLEAITGRLLVVHNAAVERAFLGRALRDQGVRLRGPLIDTEVLGRLWLAERDGGVSRNVGLGDLAAALGLPADRPHHALADALTTAQVFIAVAAHLDALQAETVGTLSKAGRRIEALRTLHGR
jgi:DNA polymerase III subunit epsilon